MRTQLCLIVVGLALGMSAFGQVSASSLETLYGTPVDGKYTVDSEVTIQTMDGPNGEACVLKVSGVTTEERLTAILDLAVPSASRGKLSTDMFECAGACERIGDYQLATIYSALFSGQTSTPSAIIKFKAKLCEQRAKEADAIGLAIKRSK